MKIFLDIDGVMVHCIPHKRVDMEPDGFYTFLPAAIAKLNELLSEGDEIILSTSHRFRYSILKWKEMLNSRGIKVENISRIALPVEELSRKDEILYWLSEQHLEPEDILIIDDCKSLNDLPERYKNKLILTDPYKGLI